MTATRAGGLLTGLALGAKQFELEAALGATILIYGHSIPFLPQKPSKMRPGLEEAVYLSTF